MKKVNTKQFFLNLENFVKKNYPNEVERLPFLKVKSWPSPKNEDWKLSRLGNLSRKNLSPLQFEDGKNYKFNKLIKNSISLVFVNGKLKNNLSDNLPSNIKLEEVNLTEINKILKMFKTSSLIMHPTLNSTLSCSEKFYKIKFVNNNNFSKPIEIFNLGGVSDKSLHPFVIFELEENIEVQLLQHFASSAGFIAPLEIINMSKKSKLEIIKIYDDEPDTYNLSLTLSLLKDNAKMNSFSLLKGSQFTRSEMHTLLEGENSNVDISGVYLSSNNQHHDLTSSVYHNVPNCKSTQTVKGVLGDKSTAVFQGKVRVEKLAQKTEAKQMSRAIMLSDEAVSNSKPELEIYADDVICGHGATIGELDEEQIFYLSSRGISKAKAKAILINAFLNEMIYSSINNKFQNIVYNETKHKIDKLLANNYD